MSMPDLVDISDLPQDMQERILKEREAKKPKVLSPIAPRERVLNFQTKEITEIAGKVDELIEQWNLLMSERSVKKEERKEIK